MVTQKIQGYVLPIVVILSIVALVTLTYALQGTQASHRLKDQSYFSRLASEAAEAGLTYATSCIRTNNNIQPWPTSTILRPTMNCAGAVTDASRTVFSRNTDYRIQTRFEVTSSTVLSQGISLTAAGFTEELNASGGVVRTSKNIVRKVIKFDTTGGVSKTVSSPERTCFIKHEKVYCWGRTYHGQLGNGQGASGVEATPGPIVLTTGLAGKRIIDVTSGLSHSCALTLEAEVWCWGENYYGQFGDGAGSYSTTPTRTTFPAGVEPKSLSAAAYTTCAIVDKVTSPTYQNKIMCWGDTYYGVTGTGINNTTMNDTSRKANAIRTPQLVSQHELGSDYQATKLASYASEALGMCAVIKRDAGDRHGAWCWGMNTGRYGVMGLGSNSVIPINYPRRVSTNLAYATGTRDVIDVTISGGDARVTGDSSVPQYENVFTAPHACMIAQRIDGTDARPYCWGNGGQGQLGNGYDGPISTANTYRNKPHNDVVWNTGTQGNLVRIVGGKNHTCALNDAGQMYCWGLNNQGGMIGQGTTAINYSTPTLVGGELAGKRVIDIGAGSNRSCAFGSGFAYCWGRNFSGQVGDGSWCDTEYASDPNGPVFYNCTRVDRRLPTRSKFLEQPPERYVF